MINFPFETKGKLTVLGVPILKHFRVSYCTQNSQNFRVFRHSECNSVNLLFFIGLENIPFVCKLQ